MSRILLIGSTGQIGRELLGMLPALGALFVADRRLCDLTKPRTLIKMMDAVKPTLVINAAAYTAVDQAEEEPALAHRINGEAPGLLAHLSRRHRALLVHYSTDYVFDGRKAEPYVESDIANPQNVYGRSKLAGEQAVREAGGDYLIFRTSWVYALHGKNFLRTILRLATEREQLRVVADQVGAPTSARLIAQSTVLALRQDLARRQMDRFESGLFHLTASGATSWHGFATAIIARAQAGKPAFKCREIVPITTAEFPLPASRPANSTLNCTRLAKRFGLRMPLWETGMHSCLADDDPAVSHRLFSRMPHSIPEAARG